MKRSVPYAFELIFVASVGLLQFAHAMQLPLDHDENQFVASGWLIAHAGLLPYRDFPYFHLPYLSLVYALVFQFTTYPLFAARLISLAASIGSALVLYLILRQLPLLQPGSANPPVRDVSAAEREQ